MECRCKHDPSPHFLAIHRGDYALAGADVLPAAILMDRRLITIRLILASLLALGMGWWVVPEYWWLWAGLVPVSLMFCPALLSPAGLCSGNCSTNTTATYQVVISGMANDDCTGCASLDGTYVLDFFDLTGGGCRWRFTSSTTPLGSCTNCTNPSGYNLDLYFLPDGANYKIVVQFQLAGPGTGTTGFKKIQATQIDCYNLSSVSVAFDTDTFCHVPSSSEACNGSAATSSVTSIP